MKVLILEDTQADVDRIKDLFGQFHPEPHIFEQVSSYESMKTSCFNEDFDVVFMNIDMDERKSLELIKLKANDRAEMILTSKDNEMMIEAYKHNISGFLSNPIDEEAFVNTMERIKKKINLWGESRKEEYGHFKELIDSGQINRIALTTLDGYVIVHYDDIIRCEANGNYTSVYFHDGSFLMLTKTLKHYASKLEGNGFFRVHKTHLVNLDYIRSYVKGKNSYVELKDGSNIEVSSRKKQTLVEMLNN